MFKKIFYKLLSALFCLCFSLTAIAQNDINKNLETLVYSSLENEKGKLFIHFDKTIYVPNETVYFAAYFINNAAYPNTAQVLNLAFVKDDDKTVLLQKKYVINEVSSTGSLIIPDSIPEGDYSVIVYPNILIDGKPNLVFTQHIKVKDPTVLQNNVVSSPTTKNNLKPTNYPINLKFYPEGGSLIADLPITIGWESRDTTGAPVKATAVLLKDNIVIDTISSSIHGLGKFSLTPTTGSKYSARLIDNINTNNIELPVVLQNGIVLSMENAAVDNSLDFKLLTTNPKKLSLVLHNTQNVFYVDLNQKIEREKEFNILLDSIPKGLTTLTIFDEQLTPIAERIFYAHFNRPSLISIKTDSLEYDKRQKIDLTLDFNSEIDSNALVSVAVVHLNRIDRRKFNNIENYDFINRDLNYLPMSLIISENSFKKEYVENVLLVRGWRSYHLTGEPREINGISGNVLKNEKPLKKPMRLTLMGNNDLVFVETDETGNFNIPNEDMGVKIGKKLSLFALGPEISVIKINFENPYTALNQKLANALPVFNKALFPINEQPAAVDLFLRHQVMIKEVSVVRSKDRNFFNSFNSPKTNECGDYVCRANILNCQNHRRDPGNKVPVIGEKYIIGQPFLTAYTGCSMVNPTAISFEGINYYKELYTFAPADIEDGLPLYNSTIYWQPDVLLTTGKPFNINFFTGDIPGNYTVIIQGITNNGVVYSEKLFSIKK